MNREDVWNEAMQSGDSRVIPKQFLVRLKWYKTDDLELYNELVKRINQKDDIIQDMLDDYVLWQLRTYGLGSKDVKDYGPWEHEISDDSVAIWCNYYL